MDVALGVIIGALFLGGLAPTRFIYSSVKEEQRLSPFDDVPALLGRLSCIGLGSTILAEAVTGKVRIVYRAEATQRPTLRDPTTASSYCRADVRLLDTRALVLRCRVYLVSSTWRRAQSR